MIQLHVVMWCLRYLQLTFYLPLFLFYITLLTLTRAVVMGRGGLANHHVGNNSFRIMTASMKLEHARLPKDEKTDVSRRLLGMVHARGGKFLAKDSVSGLFYEVENKVARRKCSQALREESKAERAARKSRKTAEAQSEEDEDEEDELEDGEGTI